MDVVVKERERKNSRDDVNIKERIIYVAVMRMGVINGGKEWG